MFKIMFKMFKLHIDMFFLSSPLCFTQSTCIYVFIVFSLHNIVNSKAWVTRKCFHLHLTGLLLGLKVRYKTIITLQRNWLHKFNKNTHVFPVFPVFNCCCLVTCNLSWIYYKIGLQNNANNRVLLYCHPCSVIKYSSRLYFVKTYKS